MHRQGVTVAVAKPNIPDGVGPIADLARQGIELVDIGKVWRMPGKVQILFNYVSRPILYLLQVTRLTRMIRRFRPDLVVLSQGGCWDGFYLSKALDRSKAAYVLICQKASDLYWPPDAFRSKVIAFIRGAKHVFCVSHHNRGLLEEQIGERLRSASVVRNPFLVPGDSVLPWPSNDTPLRLACVGRLYTMEKGQDILLRVLALPKWKARPLEVSFFGDGVHAQGLRDMAALLGCANVHFYGHVDDIAAVWATHHALVLPSRAEGLPLVLVEAMLAGRFAIVSRAGGSGEVVEDGATGFLMAGHDEEGLDLAMERAWQRRAEWEMIGSAAAQAIRRLVPDDPASELASALVHYLPDRPEPKRAR